MVNAMGPCGYEGVFRRCCENTLKVLRDNSNVFISILRPFVYDPLVEWTRVRGVTLVPTGKCDWTLDSSFPVVDTALDYCLYCTHFSATGEVNNEKAVEHLKSIRLRLTGVSRNMTKELNVALSVEAQVNYLIKEATSLENLCQMYIGWGPYL